MSKPSIKKSLARAIEHHSAGRLQPACAIYRTILARDPKHGDALHLLGLALHQSGENDKSIDYFRRAIAINPKAADYRANFAEVFRVMGRLDEAIDCYRNAIRLNPRDAEMHHLLGRALEKQEKFEDAIVAFRKSLSLRPNHAETLTDLGNALRRVDLLEESIETCRRAIQLNPNAHEPLNNLALATVRQNRVAESIPIYESALKMKELPEVRWNKGLAHLLLGDLETGFRDYEQRFDHPEFTKRRDFSQPLWDGTNAAGKTLLLHAEQGYGDSIQFIRWGPLVAPHCGKLIVECQPELKSLFADSFEGIKIVATGETLPPFDVQLPLLSLPNVVGTTIPANVPYLKGKSRPPLPGDGRKVGIAWSGNPKHLNDRARSMNPELLLPLSGLAHTAFYSLQKGHRAPMWMVDLTSELNDFSDTAALIANLDLVIGVDTSVAHLAGAMGKPVWTLLPFAPDWRWLLDRDDSPWYPTIRLFRQKRPGDWASVIESVKRELSH